jgi:hypothetical protein
MKNKIEIERFKFEIGLISKLKILNLLSLVAERPPFFFPLELEVRPVVVLGLLTRQHHPGFHQDTEEESFLIPLRSLDDAAIQYLRQGLKILEIALSDRTDEPRYLVAAVVAGQLA